MKELSSSIIIIGIIALSLFSCSSKPHSAHIEKYVSSDSLYVRYKNMISDTINCTACVDCAAMALAISYGIDEEISENHEKLAQYFKEHGDIPCPELLCDKE
ncbi:MAG: hypothetical protein ABFS35_03895 [Bacteroidota bacterium]